MPGIPFAKRYLSPVGAAKGTPPRTKAARARNAATEKAAKGGGIPKDPAAGDHDLP